MGSVYCPTIFWQILASRLDWIGSFFGYEFVKSNDTTDALIAVIVLLVAYVYFERRHYYRIIQRQQTQIDDLCGNIGTVVTNTEANPETPNRA